MKESNEDVSYEEFLEEYTIKNLVKKYSDYIQYPIKMMEEKKIKKEDSDKEETIKEDVTLNSMIPLWKKTKEGCYRRRV